MQRWGRRRVVLTLLFGVAALVVLGLAFSAISYLNRTTNTDEYRRLGNFPR